MKIINTLSIAFLLAVFIACGGSLSSPDKPPTAKQPESGTKTATSTELSFRDELDFSSAAEKVVKQHLKYPLDAKFNPGLLSAAVVRRAGTDVHVTGTVVAKNVLGAELTHEYLVVFSEDGDVALVQLGDEVVYVSQDMVDSVEKAAAAAEEEAKYRTWTDNTGQHHVEAKFVEFKGGKVRLEKRDGKIVEMSPNRLSDDDVKWYREEMKRSKDAE